MNFCRHFPMPRPFFHGNVWWKMNSNTTIFNKQLNQNAIIYLAESVQNDLNGMDWNWIEHHACLLINPLRWNIIGYMKSLSISIIERGTQFNLFSLLHSASVIYNDDDHITTLVQKTWWIYFVLHLTHTLCVFTHRVDRFQCMRSQSERRRRRRNKHRVYVNAWNHHNIRKDQDNIEKCEPTLLKNDCSAECKTQLNKKTWIYSSQIAHIWSR